MAGRWNGFGAAVLRLAAAIALVLGLVAPVAAQEGGGPPRMPAAAPVQMIPLPQRATLEPVMSCADLARRRFDGVKEGPAKILSARVTPAQAGQAEFCFVKGYVAPTIQFELRLPTHGYTGRYLQGGCGGNCGNIPNRIGPACDMAPAFGGAFAVGFEDSGHTGGDGTWALGGEQVRNDFGFRAAHAFSQAAKAIIATFYGQAPAYAYFDGCSDGGREGMSLSQRYPKDFNGIVAGSPAFIITEAMERFIWEAQKGHDADGKAIFDEASAGVLHKAVMTACDGLDGLKDGQIDDPRVCRFDPRTIICKKPGQTDCLTAAQAEAAIRFYDGPRDPTTGKAVYIGGEAYGSELSWVQGGGLAQAGYGMLADAVRNMMYLGELPADVTVANWKFDEATFHDLSRRGAVYDANDPDLTAFKAAGGKIIYWYGAADPAAGVLGVPDYYQRVQNRMGGLAEVKTFARVFVIPGVYHCAGGYVPYSEDYLGAIVNWVETGSAPDKLMASAYLDGTTTIRTRPIFPYPTQARYLGKGDINDPANFGPRDPKGPINDLYDWAGAPAAK